VGTGTVLFKRVSRRRACYNWLIGQ
jgi:hypothetical protein